MHLFWTYSHLYFESNLTHIEDHKSKNAKNSYKPPTGLCNSYKDVGCLTEKARTPRYTPQKTPAQQCFELSPSSSFFSQKPHLYDLKDVTLHRFNHITSIKDGVFFQISAFDCGGDAGALPAAYALWVLSTGAAGVGCSICLVGIQLLSEREDGDDGHIHCTGSALPTICESGFGTRSVESGGCCGGGIPCLDLVAREEDE